MGRLGQKTGAGWYRYEKGDRTPHPDPEVQRIIKEVAQEMGIEQRSFSDEEILRRLLFASVNEACKILEEGKALRASDVDVMWLHGFGFPRYRGGLMFWADRSARREVYNQIDDLAPALRRALEALTTPAGAGPKQQQFARGEGQYVKCSSSALVGFEHVWSSTSAGPRQTAIRSVDPHSSRQGSSARPWR